jgi:hypothetical protein
MMMASDGGPSLVEELTILCGWYSDWAGVVYAGGRGVPTGSSAKP